MIERERERGERRKKKKGTSTNVILVDVYPHAYDISEQR